MEKLNLNAVEAVYDASLKDREELGLLMWYMIYDNPVTREMLKSAFSEAGLDEEFLPAPIQIQDVFRRTTSIRRKRLPVEDSTDIFANYYVTEVSSTKEFIVRVLVKDVVDAGNITLSHEDIGKVILDREQESVNFEIVGEIDRDLLEYLTDLKDRFSYYCQFYNGKILRELIRGIIGSTNTVSLRDQGSVYFVPRQHKGLIQKLQKMVDVIQGKLPEDSRRSSIKAVTLMNKEQEKVIIRETIEDHVKAKTGLLKDFIEEVAVVLQNNGSVRQKEVEKYLKDAQMLALTVKRYEDLLEDDLNSLRVGIDVMKVQLSELLGRTREDNESGVA